MNAAQLHGQHELCVAYDEHLQRDIEEARRQNRATIARMESEFHRRKGHGAHITNSQPTEQNDQ